MDTYQQLNFNYSPYVKQLNQLGDIQSRVNPISLNTTNSQSRWSQNLPPKTVSSQSNTQFSNNHNLIMNQLEPDVLYSESISQNRSPLNYQESRPMSTSNQLLNNDILNQKSRSLIQQYNKYNQHQASNNIIVNSAGQNQTQTSNNHTKQVSLFNASSIQGSVFNSNIKKNPNAQIQSNKLNSSGNNNNKIDFTDIMNQLSQPSSLETPFKDDQQLRQYLVCNGSELGDSTVLIGGGYQEQESFKPPQQEMYIQDQQMTYEIDGFQIQEELGNQDELRQQDLIVGGTGQKNHVNGGTKRIIFEIKDQSSADQSKSKKVNVKDMASQLDDLKDHIKNLEQKIETTSQNIMQSSQKPQNTSTTSLNRHNSAYFKVSEQLDKKKEKPTKDKRKHSAQKSNKKHQKNISWGDSQLIQESQGTDDYGRRRSSMGLSSMNSRDHHAQIKQYYNMINNKDKANKAKNKLSEVSSATNNMSNYQNRLLSDSSHGQNQNSNRSKLKSSKFDIVAQNLNLKQNSKHQRNKSLDSFSSNTKSKGISSSQTKKFNISIAGGVGSFINNAKQRSGTKFDHHRGESDGLSTYRMSSDFTCSGLDPNRRFSEIEIPFNYKQKSRQNQTNALIQSHTSNNRNHSKIGASTTETGINLTQVSQGQSKTKHQDSSNYQSNSNKAKECEMYKQKCFKYQKKIKLLKSELQEKDTIINNYKNLNKELKTIKDQYRMSEDIRDQQTQQLKKLQALLQQSQKEIAKYRKKFTKLKEKENMPIKVMIEDRSSFNMQQNASSTNITEGGSQKGKKKSLQEKSSQ
ncbi:UNKNOWN [Stylonychia lemnae]|uniref:Uncharacterized protein n=1 Tax=Stylonychia lemnae TaxID=5949 RepID=A0A078ACQ3_STYLE|nr:UNKNOWN [Stylonychia lemnae]|eukprot:CDW78618.1 UNKNOWN [Stylonychia lemnae]